VGLFHKKNECFIFQHMLVDWMESEPLWVGAYLFYKDDLRVHSIAVLVFLTH
jgi:hypothetical protein